MSSSLLPVQVSRDYHNLGLWATLHTPKHLANAVVIHIIARALRWQIDLMLGQFLPDNVSDSWRCRDELLFERIVQSFLGVELACVSTFFRRSCCACHEP